MSNVEPIEPGGRGRKRNPSRVPPHNLGAEESVLGALLLSREAQADVIDRLAPDDFYKPGHQHIFDAIGGLWRVGHGSVDVVTVSNELRRTGLLDEVGGTEYLMGLQNAIPAISHADRYATIVLQASQHRQVIGLSTKAIESAYGETEIAEIVQTAKADLDILELRGGVHVDVTSGEDFIANKPDPHDWVMPFILERDDRLLLTGGEGAKKSLLLMQLAVMAAAGVHWWARLPVPSQRVLFLDLEIGLKRTRRRAHLFENEADHAKQGWWRNLVIRSRSEDIDITTRAGASWLASIVEQAEPDIMFIGPIYRLTSGLAKAGDIGGEDAAKQAAFALDRIREHYGCALVAETHAAKGDTSRSRDMRPFGSSVWTRWPEFGYALVRRSTEEADFNPEDRDWVGWRGDRDPREWPAYFRWTEPHLPGWMLCAEFDKAPTWMTHLGKGRFDVPLPASARPVQQGMRLDDEDF